MSEKADRIVVGGLVNAEVAAVWHAWTNPECIVQWNAATDDWHCPSAVNDLRPGGSFSYRMEARDRSFGFDFEGTFDEVIPNCRIAYHLSDAREVVVEFEPQGSSTRVTQTFQPDPSQPLEMQRMGWQMILDNFCRFAARSQH